MLTAAAIDEKRDLSLLRNLLAKVRPVFHPLEQQLLAAVEAGLSPAAAAIFRHQVEEVNLVQRHSREVNCYRMVGRRPSWDPSLLFPDCTLERELARVRFRVPAQDGKPWKVSFFLVKGHFFSMVFDRPAAAIQKEAAEIFEVRILADPMRPASPVIAQPLQGEPRFEGWLGDWARKYKLKGVLAPLDPSDRQRRLSEISAKLPQDYLKMIEQTDGFSVGKGQVFGLAETYGISLDSGDYQVIAELNGDGVLGVETEADDQVWFLSYQKDEPRRAVASFREGIEAYLEGRQR